VEIRPFKAGDAPAVVALELELKPQQVLTAPGLLHDIRRAPERERRRDWVALLDGELVGHAVAGFNWAVPTEGKGWLIVKVLPPERRQGIGTELFRLAEKYLQAEHAIEFRSWTHHPDGQRFLAERGFQPNRTMEVSALDLSGVDLSALAVLEAAKSAEGFRLVPLADVGDSQSVHAIYATGEEDMPSDEPETELDYETWVAETLEHPELTHQGSVLVLADDRPVALAFLCADPVRRLGYNEMTATLPEFRRRDLALLAKLAAVRWCREVGLKRLLTENDGANDGMLAINRRLGYETVLVEQQFLRR
jgi:GNAT superfamily N-acetyltransferase